MGKFLLISSFHRELSTNLLLDFVHQSLILDHLPNELRADDHFIAVLNLALTASILKSAQRSEAQRQVHVCEEKLNKLREELSKSEQDLKAILEIIRGLRKAFDSPNHSSNVWDGSEETRLSEDLFADADKLLKFAMAT